MSDTILKVKHVISGITGVEESQIKPEAFFMEDLNIDELELSEVISKLEDILNIELKVPLEDIKTVADLLHAINDVVE